MEASPAAVSDATSAPKTCWKLVTARVRVSLSPAELHSSSARALASRRAISALLMRHHPAFDGVVVAHRGPLRFGPRPLAPSNPASPFSHVPATADLLVFAPPPGLVLDAKVSHVGPDHVGMALWDTFHVVLALSEAPDAFQYDSSKRLWRCVNASSPVDITLGSVVRFAVVEMKAAQTGIFHVVGTLLGQGGSVRTDLGVRKERTLATAGRGHGNVDAIATANGSGADMMDVDEGRSSSGDRSEGEDGRPELTPFVGPGTTPRGLGAVPPMFGDAFDDVLGGTDELVPHARQVTPESEPLPGSSLRGGHRRAKPAESARPVASVVTFGGRRAVYTPAEASHTPPRRKGKSAVQGSGGSNLHPLASGEGHVQVEGRPKLSPRGSQRRDEESRKVSTAKDASISTGGDNQPEARAHSAPAEKLSRKKEKRSGSARKEGRSKGKGSRKASLPKELAENGGDAEALAEAGSSAPTTNGKAAKEPSNEVEGKMDDEVTAHGSYAVGKVDKDQAHKKKKKDRKKKKEKKSRCDEEKAETVAQAEGAEIHPARPSPANSGDAIISTGGVDAPLGLHANADGDVAAAENRPHESPKKKITISKKRRRSEPLEKQETVEVSKTGQMPSDVPKVEEVIAKTPLGDRVTVSDSGLTIPTPGSGKRGRKARRKEKEEDVMAGQVRMNGGSPFSAKISAQSGVPGQMAGTLGAEKQEDVEAAPVGVKMRGEDVLAPLVKVNAKAGFDGGRIVVGKEDELHPINKADRTVHESVAGSGLLIEDELLPRVKVDPDGPLSAEVGNVQMEMMSSARLNSDARVPAQGDPSSSRLVNNTDPGVVGDERARKRTERKERKKKNKHAQKIKKLGTRLSSDFKKEDV